MNNQSIPPSVIKGDTDTNENHNEMKKESLLNIEELIQLQNKAKSWFHNWRQEFDTAELYEQYSSHPDHVHFVQTYWVKSVEDFLEIDYELLDTPFSNYSA